MFNDMGYICGGPANEWDVLWTHHAPFAKPLDLRNVINNMQGHQKVQHFIVFRISKRRLETSVKIQTSQIL